MFRFTAPGSWVTSRPQPIAVPAVGARKPVIIFMVGDLPAPLGPRKPSASPRGTENDTLSTARMGPNLLVRLRIAIISDISSCPSNVFGRAGPARLAAKIDRIAPTAAPGAP